MEKIISSNTLAMSEDIRALSQAFLLAKQAFTATGLTGKNTFNNSTYATLKDIYKSVESSLFANNIVIWHFVRPTDNKDYLYTRLIHTLTGQYIEDVRLLISEKPGNQGHGTANTYMKRYAVLSLCAIASSEEDDDGQQEARHIERKSSSPRITQEQLILLHQELKTCSNGKKLYTKILATEYIKDLAEMQASSFNDVMDYIAKDRE